MAELTSTNVYGKLNVTRELQVTPKFSLKDSADRPGLLELEALDNQTWVGIQNKNSDGQLWSFMSSNTQAGIYDDTNSDWILLYTENGATSIRYNGTERILTSNTGIDVTGQVNTDSLRLVSGMDSSIDMNDLQIDHLGEVRFSDNVSGVKLNWEWSSTENYSEYYDDSPNTYELRNGVASGTGGTVIFQVDFDTGLTRAANDIVAYYSFSDKRLKNNIKNIGYVSDKLMDLEPITFNWKDTTVDIGTHYGFIAQQAEKIFPETVVEDLLLNDGKKYKRIRYDEYAPILTKAFQEQQEKIKKQDKTIQSLEDKINRLEKLIQDKIK